MKKWIRRFVPVFGIALLAFGCAPNHRTVITPAVEATGSIIADEGQFYSIQIGSPETPLGIVPDFAIRFSDGTILRSSDFSFDRIASISERLSDSSDPASGAEGYRIEGATFYFRDSTLVWVRLAEIMLEDEILNIDLGKIDGKEFFNLPLPESKLIEIFGAPTEVRDRFVL